MSQYSARGIAGWEFPPVVSYGAFKAATGETLYLNCPVMLDGTRHADDGNKYGIKAYDDALGVSGCLGFGYRNLPARDDDETDRDTAGRGGIRRDFGIMHEGILDVYWAESGVASAYGKRVAPHPSGVQAWATGMAIAGFVLEPSVTGLTDDSFMRIRVWTYESENGYF